jgi:hypothetical protein
MGALLRVFFGQIKAKRRKTCVLHYTVVDLIHTPQMPRG